MKHNKMIIAAVAACIVLSAATIGAQSWKRSLGKLKQGVEQVTRQSKPNTTRQSGDVQVPEWHEERAQKRTSGLPSSVDTVVNHLRYRLRPDKRYAEFMGVDDYLFQETEVVEILGFVNFKGVRCSVTEINSEALKGETAHTLVIPSSVKEIGPYAFAYMNNLKSVKVPASVRTIKRGAFAGCTNLSSITIEPGVYTEGSHGVRIENTAVVAKGEKTEYGQFLHFETFTVVPIDTTPLNLDMMSQEEIDWLNDFNRRAYETVAPHVSERAEKWLKKATAPISK